MNRLFAAVVVALALCSCLSRNYRIVAAQGRQSEACVSVAVPERLSPAGYRVPLLLSPAGDEADLQLMRVGNAYYLEGMRCKVRKHFDFPQQCLIGLGCNDKNVHRIPVSGTGPRMWRRVVVKKGCYVGPATGSEWEPQLPAGARPVMVSGKYAVGASADVYGEEEFSWHALYAYPLAAATAVCVDLPCTVVGSVLVGGVVGGLLVAEAVSPRRPISAPVIERSDNQNES